MTCIGRDEFGAGTVHPLDATSNDSNRWLQRNEDRSGQRATQTSSREERWIQGTGCSGPTAFNSGHIACNNRQVRLLVLQILEQRFVGLPLVSEPLRPVSCRSSTPGCRGGPTNAQRLVASAIASHRSSRFPSPPPRPFGRGPTGHLRRERTDTVTVDLRPDTAVRKTNPVDHQAQVLSVASVSAHDDGRGIDIDERRLGLGAGPEGEMSHCHPQPVDTRGDTEGAFSSNPS